MDLDQSSRSRVCDSVRTSPVCSDRCGDGVCVFQSFEMDDVLEAQISTRTLRAWLQRARAPPSGLIAEACVVVPVYGVNVNDFFDGLDRGQSSARDSCNVQELLPVTRSPTCVKFCPRVA